MAEQDRWTSVRRVLFHPRTQTAVKASLAAGLSWVLAGAVTGTVPFFDVASYQYYAPLGAVVATHPTVAESWRTARSAVLSLALGAAVGLLVQLNLQPGAVSLAVAVGAGVAVGTLPWIGPQRSWVPIVALFVLVVGQQHPLDYAVAYVGLTGLGTACGVVVNMVLPALRLTAAQESLDGLRSELATHLRDSAGALRQSPPPTAEEWRGRVHDPLRQSRRTREAVQQVLDASRGNVRAWLHSREIERQRGVAHALERVALLVEDLPGMLEDTYREDQDRPALDPELAVAAAESLERLADLVRVYDVDLGHAHPCVEAAEEAVQRLTLAVGLRRELDATDVALLGSLVGTLRRALSAVEPSRAHSR